MRVKQKTDDRKTRDRIVTMLRRGGSLVDELAAALEAHPQCRPRTSDRPRTRGTVHQTAVRHEGAVGKPPTTWGITAAAEQRFSNAYAPVLGALIASLAEKLTPRERDGLYRNVGERLSASAVGARRSIPSMVSRGGCRQRPENRLALKSRLSTTRQAV